MFLPGFKGKRIAIILWYLGRIQSKLVRKFFKKIAKFVWYLGRIQSKLVRKFFKKIAKFVSPWFYCKIFWNKNVLNALLNRAMRNMNVVWFIKNKNRAYLARSIGEDKLWLKMYYNLKNGQFGMKLCGLYASDHFISANQSSRDNISSFT